MNIFDIIRDSTIGAPRNPPNRVRQRANARNPELPADHETFGSYYRRAGQAPELADAVRRPARRVGPSAAARAAQDVTATRGQMQTVGQAVAEGAAQIHNAASMDIARIPMGVRDAFPRMTAPGLPTMGQKYATGARFDGNGVPVELNSQRIDWNDPSRRAGIVRWGVDLRRPEADVFGDVERVSGAPPGLLNAISMRESDMSSRQYDQGGPDSTSAQGPHQFTEGTWKEWLVGTGALYGVPVAMLDRREMMDMRHDARASGAMTAESARYYRGQILGDSGGPEPSVAEYYLGHHGGDHGVNVVRALRAGGHDGDPITAYYSAREIAADPNLYLVGGTGGRPRTIRQFFNWATGQDANSPHRRNYNERGNEGMSTAPMPAFSARADGTNEAAVVVRPGVVALPTPARSTPQGQN